VSHSTRRNAHRIETPFCRKQSGCRVGILGGMGISTRGDEPLVDNSGRELASASGHLAEGIHSDPLFARKVKPQSAGSQRLKSLCQNP